MTVKLSLLQERVEYIVAEFGDNVKVGEPNERGFVELEFNNPDSTDLVNMFHAGFQCGFEYMKKHTAHLV